MREETYEIYSEDTEEYWLYESEFNILIEYD